MKHTLLLAFTLVSFTHGLRLPWQKKKYTPLIFFTMPKDSSPECDALEERVKQVEKELDVQVERLDVVKDPPAQVLLELLASAPPLLYNRESCQVIRVTPKQQAPISKQRIVAWAKGRRLAPVGNRAGAPGKVKAPIVISQEDNALDQDELLQELNQLTPLQQEGKKAIQERTNKKASEGKE